jgi:3-oxoacyl-[acyl-carrier protein] reductase
MIIVTGASRGLGNAICCHLIAKGVEVIGLARNVSSLNFPSFVCDVSSAEQVKEVATCLKKEGILVSGLINAAGIASMNLALTTPVNTTDRIIKTNLLGSIYTCQKFAPLMIKNGSGSIINFSTIAVSLGLKGESIYVASKAGVEGFSKSFAREMSEFNINVNCIAPGPINTDILNGVAPKKISNIVNQQIIKKQFSPEDVCNIVDLLLDERSRSLSGQVFNIGGF